MSGPVKILIVDDEQNMLVTLKDIFTVLGYEITTVDSGNKAIEIAKDEKFCVILMDFKMPDINGVETSREIKKIDPDAKIIFITAYYDEGYTREDMEEVAYGIYHKPFNIPELIEHIKSAAVGCN